MPSYLFFHFDVSSLHGAVSDNRAETVQIVCDLNISLAGNETIKSITELYNQAGTGPDKPNVEFQISSAINTMTQFQVTFNSSDLLDLLDPPIYQDNVLVSCRLNNSSGLDHSNISTITAQVYDSNGNKLLGSPLNGCPVPPCVKITRLSAKEKANCLREYEKLLNKFGFNTNNS